MTLITPDAEPTELGSSIALLQRQLADMRAEMEAIQDRIRAGEFDEIRNAARAIAEIRQWLRIALETEAQIEKRHKQDKGIHHDYALDLDEARSSVRCRLDRLRRCGCSGRVPE
ncbi:hypothetical protein [Roseovarius salinarum]|uniref:hypothetical protein n=1 Tax=Roseovarius salinarum TaxID=1981892 RepID=UPI000C32DF53|nr:hypothetical protein [Roseovarius salinarum]